MPPRPLVAIRIVRTVDVVGEQETPHFAGMDSAGPVHPPQVGHRLHAHRTERMLQPGGVTSDEWHRPVGQHRGVHPELVIVYPHEHGSVTVHWARELVRHRRRTEASVEADRGEECTQCARTGPAGAAAAMFQPEREEVLDFDVAKRHLARRQVDALHQVVEGHRPTPRQIETVQTRTVDRHLRHVEALEHRRHGRVGDRVHRPILTRPHRAAKPCHRRPERESRGLG